MVVTSTSARLKDPEAAPASSGPLNIRSIEEEERAGGEEPEEEEEDERFQNSDEKNKVCQMNNNLPVFLFHYSQ